MNKKRLAISSIVFIFFFLYNSSSVKSQTSLELKSSLTSRHYWRGIMVSNSANYEGDLILQVNNFKFGAWGGYAFDNEYSEFDFHFGFTISKHLSIEIWDLYASRDRASIDEYDYFDFDRKSTNHLLDASINYSFGNNFPLTICWSSLVWGRDLDEHNNQNFSSYLELAYPINIKDTHVKFYMGTNVFENSMYGSHTNIVNMGLSASRNLKLNEYLSLPVWAKMAINPEAETANLIVGINF